MGSNENLENLLRSGGLKAEPPDRKECEGLMRSAVDRSLYWPHREQARSHIGSASYTKPLWERACSRWRRHGQPLT